MPETLQYDVVILGAGLAGLTLARQLLLYTDRTILILDKQENPPGKSQKVGESLVQLAGYYLSKTLDLEYHLLVNHYLKYNLRFHWKTDSGKHDYWNDISSAAIRSQSNLATFQVDRNLLEQHLLEINSQNPRFRFIGGVRNLKAELSESDGAHKVTWTAKETDGQAAPSLVEAAATWVVDASGRPGILKRGLALEKKNSIQHGSTWCWVDGQVNPERLTELSYNEQLLHRKRQKVGNFPFYLATNHFCGEGRWFWVIPLHGMTSLGFVYDHSVVNPEEVSNGRKMLDFVAKEWPIFAEDFRNRKIIDEGRFTSFSFDAQQTISPARWAITGEAGRFSDPLYSPGSDLIAIYNTLIIDAIQAESTSELEVRCSFYEQIMRVMYSAYLPSYELSYDCLGDAETLTLKYTWELAVYFGFYVLPFINQLFTNQKFMRTYLRKFAFFGPVNHTLQAFLSGYFQWKKAQGLVGAGETVHVDFYDLCPLRNSEKLFYEVGLTVEEAEQKIEMHQENMKEFARYIQAHVYAAVLGDKRVLLNAPFIRSLKVREMKFDPALMREQYAKFAASEEIHQWNLNPFALECFIPDKVAEAVHSCP